MEVFMALIIIFAVMFVIRKLLSETEGMESLEDYKERLNYHYLVMGDNIIYSRDYENMYKLGHHYFLAGNYDKMMKYFRPLIDAYNHFDRLGDDPEFMSREKLCELHTMAQEDINNSVEEQKDCNDMDNCLDTNLVLPVAL